MEIKTCEQKVLADLEEAERILDEMRDENARLRDEVERLEKRVIDLGEQAHRLLVERDHHADCVGDMLATAAFYGFKQPTAIRYNPETQTMQPADEDEKCVIYTGKDEGLA